ncbi:hypothetical protein [Streptomyces marincola]|uniref:Capsular polysaccharide biosynthesis protein n=1 Tax=Streptomyces marincola TaxID=2878388 RepID=A0A1W7CY67_9ACTN|nr:hypothetical protein [Streptomyces marincola]ARQ69712.1 hypothetical protein CAG99_13305 [Streptomyces marincola]
MRGLRAWAAGLPGWWPAVLGLLLGLLAGAGHALWADREYAAEASVVVTADDPAQAVGFAQSYGRLATGDAVLRTAQTDAGVPAGTLRTRVRAGTSPDAPVIGITGTGPRPQDAARAAGAVARALVAHTESAGEATGVRVVPLTEAALPTAAASPVPWLSVALGGCAGAVAGGAAVLARGGGPRPSRPRGAFGRGGPVLVTPVLGTVVSAAVAGPGPAPVGELTGAPAGTSPAGPGCGAAPE